MHKVSEIEFESPANEIHCILYVINAKTNLTSMPESLKVMTEILQSKNEEGNFKNKGSLGILETYVKLISIF